jgi:uncharacterized protein YcgI (DUF1989 family)
MRAAAIIVPARRGKAIRVPAGSLVRVINTHGKQVVDTWALNADDSGEHMSMEHTRAYLRKLSPGRGDALVTNHRRPILSLEEDTTPGVHDTLIAACDRYRYEQLGVVGYHDNCTDNFAAALRELGATVLTTPAPLNLFMNIPIAADGGVEFRAPLSDAGQFVGLRVHMDAILVFSACPQDLLPVNGEHMTPTEVHLALDSSGLDAR